MRFSLTLSVVALMCLWPAVRPAHSDPCGMVPPLILIDNKPAIERVGKQKTYVLYKDGVETMVLRAGFSGKVDSFGMLIPFPTVPAIRKVDENIFAQLASAVDPPEVIAYVQQAQPNWAVRSSAAPSAAGRGKAEDEGPLRYDEVKVVNREAVGMYDVAVLKAGSASALKKWMETNGFVYPDGMDDVVDQYVDMKWVFVAVKTRVGQKDGVNPKPGKRDVNSKLPAGSTFNGHVQAMGFRFKTDKFVVPMRLSAYNAGIPDNMVFVLTDQPVKFEQLPKRFVVRQVPGKQLYTNVTKPLPLRVIGGTFKDLAPWQKQQLKTQRDPAPFNGTARTLFASDLLAIRKGRLANPDEEREKALLNISERLGLRGPEIDALHGEALKKDRDKAVKAALRDLDGMTMTVLDGIFDKKILAKEELTVAKHVMPKARNNRENFDTRIEGPGGPPIGGKLYHGALDVDREDETAAVLPRRRSGPVTTVGDLFRGLGLGAGVFVLGMLVLRRNGRRRAGPAAIAILIGTSALLAAGVAMAQKGSRTLSQMIADLGDEKQAEATVELIVQLGDPAIDDLLDEVVDGTDEVRRGWALVALGEIGGEKADKGLEQVHNNPNLPVLIRTWAIAARFSAAKDTATLVSLANLTWTLPGLTRPFGLRAAALLGTPSTAAEAEKALLLLATVPQLQAELAPVILAIGEKPLVEVMTTSGNVNVRSMAAAYLGSIGATDGNQVVKTVLRALQFSASAKTVPWDGGALFLPAIQWSKDDARALADRLIRWMVWAEAAGKPEIAQQIENNLRSAQLVNAAGYAAPAWGTNGSDAWLTAWSVVVGKKHIARLVAQQKLTDRYKALLDKL